VQKIDSVSIPREPAAVPPSFGARLGRAYQALERPIFSIGAILVVIAIWEWIGTNCFMWDWLNKDCKSSPLFVSSPTKVALAAAKYWNSGDIWEDLSVSGQEFGLGFALAIIVGIPFGLLMGWYRKFNYVFDPFVAAGNATPRVALTPLLIIWLGIGIWSKVALVFLGGVFPIILNTESGVRALDETLLRAARSFGANDRQIFRTIALPGSVPFILSGIRVGLGRALVGIVVGELLGSVAGVGHTIAFASQMFQTDRMFVGVLILTVFGVLLTNLLNRLEHTFDAWRPKRN
jgi:NitT/TauT family transport system permease protein